MAAGICDAKLILENKMKTIVLLLIGAATLFVTAGCEEGHEHRGHYGGAYDGGYGGTYDRGYRDYGHDRWSGRHEREGHWDRDDD